MSLTTAKRTSLPTAEEREQILKEMMLYHKDKFASLGVEPSKSTFYPKTVFVWKDEAEFISLYERELTGPAFYIELTDKFYNPQKERKLYCWKGNPEYVNEYHKKQEATYVRYFVPVEELIPVNALAEALAPRKLTTKQSSTPVTSAPVAAEEVIDNDGITNKLFSKLTVLDYCAIHWQKVVKGAEPFINEAIKRTLYK